MACGIGRRSPAMQNAPVSTTSYSHLQDVLQHAETSCIKCGFCLPTCPTYRLTGHEAASPRGRIDLMQAVVNGDLAAGEIFAQLDFCLGCRACETACPAGVEFGKLLEAGRAEARPGHTGSRLGAWVQRLGLREVLAMPSLVQQLASLLYLYQASGLQHLLRRSGVLRHLTPTLAAMDTLLPRVPAAAQRRPVPAETPPVGAEQGRVALLTGCIVPAMLPEVNRATVRVLAANGYRVYAPAAQRCCGALQAHAGERATARQLARHNIAVFEATGADWVVVNSAGCGALMKEYSHLLSD